MIERSVEVFPDFKIYITSLHGRLFVSASVEESGSDVEHIAGEIFVRIAEVLSDFSAQIVHEQCFGSLGIRKHLLKARAQAFISRDIEPGTPLTYIDGEPCSESKNFSGIQIRALKISNDEKVRTILDNGIPRGRAWNQNGAAFFMLHNVDGKNQSDRLQADQQSKYEAMFHEAERLLNAEGASYKDVVRTWIYISDILDWYDDFNAARNYCYTENGLIGKSKTGLQAEQIYLPASTGIEGKNPSSTPAIMDVFAIHRESGSEVKIRPIYGIKQRSAFRYGSAFSRAMVIEEPGVRQILVSGTASIDENGKSVFKGCLCFACR